VLMRIAIAIDAVFWEEKVFLWGDKIQEKSKYSGKPSPELDQAWHDLLNGTSRFSLLLVVALTDNLAAENIRIETEVMKRLGREDIGVRIPGDDAFIGTLNVYHEIHCLVSQPPSSA
jgi:hypothetical protein